MRKVGVRQQPHLGAQVEITDSVLRDGLSDDGQS